MSRGQRGYEFESLENAKMGLTGIIITISGSL